MPGEKVFTGAQLDLFGVFLNKIGYLEGDIEKTIFSCKNHIEINILFEYNYVEINIFLKAAYV